ncbi:hypothetical protein BMS3Abin15_00610 [bacterium BMS3Abin15]|nr:hypothetical protein BMS3Abin15_00610 [bacterium BMS3Abin15]
MEENTQGNVDNAKRWLQDNLRIIISIVIVVAIAGGIYSYSKRSQAPVVSEEAGIEKQAIDDTDLLMTDEAGEINGGEVTEETGEAVQQEEAPQEQVTSAATSNETDGSFIETAGAGDGRTHLARRALANYLEKNPDSELKAEHKIYIEDYLRKKVDFQGRVFVGTSVEFSKDLIQEAIGEAKGLNDAQIKNLQKYTVLAPSLS